MTKTDHNIYLYTDGSSMSIGDKEFESASACILYLDDKFYGKGKKYFPTGTISEGEVSAMYLGLYKAKEIMDKVEKPVNLFVYSDSNYVVKSLTTWIKNWSKTPLDEEWISSTGNPVAYQELFKPLWRDFFNGKSPYKRWIHIYHINSHVTKGGVDKARFSFMNENQIDLSTDEFRMHMERNDAVDKLACEARIGKLKDPVFECDDEVLSEWLSKINLPLVNGKVIISR